MLSKSELTNVSSKRDFSDTRGFTTPQYTTSKYNMNHGRSNTSHGFKPRKFNVEDELPRLRKKYEGGIWGYGQRLQNDLSRSAIANNTKILLSHSKKTQHEFSFSNINQMNIHVNDYKSS